ncbi:MAG: hypothetical protein RJA70_471 [Pseudomonadota bacterium]|jgi:predicted AAA+ superfamily ATPase
MGLNQRAASFDQPNQNISFSRSKTLHLAEYKAYDEPVSEAALYPRYAEARLSEALVDSPVVLIHGPRQCGKTTLAQVLGKRLNYAYLTFDDDVARGAAAADPVGFVADLPERAILDEVQRVPSLFAALKTAIDRKRVAGRFILTGSANVLLVPKLADSLAGRMHILRLHPLAACEIVRRPPGFLDALFEKGFKVRSTERLGRQLVEQIVAGGYPVALARPAGRRRASWYRDYLEALVQRDVRALARISSLDVLPRLLALAAAQTAGLLNVSDLASPFQLSRPTIRDYVTLLERVFLLDTLPPWHSNRLSRLVKTPKVHVGDTGLACALLGVDAAALAADRPLLGHVLETFVFQELRRQASWHEEPMTFFHYRDRDGVEVDIVIERGSRKLVGVEVKAAATVTAADFRGLRKLREIAGARFAGGVVLYDGETSASFGDGLHAVPLRALWETT